MNILVISLAGIGDTLFATPLIHELRENFPAARIDALVLWSGSRDLLAGNPHLTRVHQKNLLQAGRVESLRFLLQLRRERYAISLNTHPQSRVHYRVVARLVGAQKRLSHAYDHSGLADRWLVNHMVPQDYDRHCIENNLALLPLIGGKPLLRQHDYELYLSPEERRWAEEYIAANQLGQRRLVGIHVGSGGTKNLALRRWPLANYIELVKRLLRERPELSVLVFGGPEEEKDSEELIRQTDPKKVLRPPTRSLRQAAALVKHCAAFLSVDTALMHLAAAMKVPGQVVIETPTWNKPIEPYHQRFELVPNPAVAGRNLAYYRYDGEGIKGTPAELLRCMASVEVPQVFESLIRVLAQS